MMLSCLSLRAWRLRRYRRCLSGIGTQEAALQSATDEELARKSAELKQRARAGQEPAALVVDAFSLMREACRRTVGLRHYDVQLLAGAALCERSIVEMQTGEGKTLTASLPLYLFGLYGRGAYLATSNDYLAARDADYLRPAFRLLGLTVGAVVAEQSLSDRRLAYCCDVTYGTGKEFGFDFLRDQFEQRREQEPAAGSDIAANEPLQRSPFFLLVDEADAVLLDDACTPLILAGAPQAVSPAAAVRINTATEHSQSFTEGRDYIYDERTKQVQLTAEGRERVRRLPYSFSIQDLPWASLYEDVELALLARRNFRRDRQYLVRDGAVHVLDEATGRVAEGRKWRHGLHQTIESQEGLTVTGDGGQAARVTVQDFCLRFPNLSGMTGTAATAAHEFRQIYRLATVVVPTNKPSQRRALPPHVFSTAEEKWRAIVVEVRNIHELGRPVLVGTGSIAHSETLSHLLHEAGLPHTVLNAREIALEAEIVAAAGRWGSITVATNMAGRGTDIQLGPGVAELGGLHVILAEMHAAARIDRQFIGRGARQGDPGTYRIFLALDDELLSEGLGPRSSTRRPPPTRGDGQLSKDSHDFVRAQRALERRHFEIRRELLEQEHRRRKICRDMGLNPYVDLPDA
jgi:preprotein translocase subunit SecA